LVSVGAQGHVDHPARDPRALAPSRIAAILALEIPLRLWPSIAKEAAQRLTAERPFG
jgi:hypothetical protein